MDELKIKLKKIVKEYKRLMPEEFKAVEKQVLEVRNNQKDKFSDMTKMTDTFERPLMMWPETLFAMITNQLTGDEYKEVFNNKDHKMINWCAKEFHQFRIPEIV